MQNEFKQRLLAVRATAEQVYKTCMDPKTVCQEIMKELGCYTTIIPEFFSYTNEAVRIKALYKKLKELDYTRNRVIPCIKVSCAGFLYKDYFDGMYKFLDNLFREASSNGENIQMMEKQLQTAIQGDPLFIESLFGGKNNEMCQEELTDAIQNVEYLVDFLDYLKSLTQMVGDICNRGCECSEYSHTIDAVKLAANSASIFCSKVLSTIMDTYYAIQNALDNKVDAPAEDTTLKVF